MTKTFAQTLLEQAQLAASGGAPRANLTGAQPAPTVDTQSSDLSQQSGTQPAQDPALLDDDELQPIPVQDLQPVNPAHQAPAQAASPSVVDSLADVNERRGYAKFAANTQKKFVSRGKV